MLLLEILCIGGIVLSLILAYVHEDDAAVAAQSWTACGLFFLAFCVLVK